MAEQVIDPIIRWIVDAGWSPEAPNGQCARAIARPSVFARLKPEDADGAHFVIAYMEYDRLLDSLDFDELHKHKVQLSAATFAVLYLTGRQPATTESWQNSRYQFERWLQDVWQPAGAKLDATLRSGPDPDWLYANRAEFEPAYTLQQAMHGRFFSLDIEADFRAMGKGLAMYAHGVIHPQEPPRALEFDDFMKCVIFMNTPEESVSSYGPDGLLCIDAYRVKTVLDSRSERVATPEEHTPILEGVDPASGDAGVEAALREADVVRVVRDAAQTRIEAGKGEPAMVTVQRHLSELVNGNTSIRRLSIATGISREALQRAYDMLLDRLRRKFA